jgi:anaphase-promoting complex subunit 2
MLQWAQKSKFVAQGGAALDMWESRLSYYVYETIGCLRIACFFDMVVDYPDSQPALEDLRECLRHTNLHSHFISKFSAAIRQRLLHAGALAGLHAAHNCM